MKPDKYIGTSTGCENAFDKVTGRLRFCADLKEPGQLHMKLCPATVTHGRVISIDTSRAEKMPGVRAVYTWQNTPQHPYDRGRVVMYEHVTYQERLFDPHIRYYGERIAAVVADTAEHAEAACREITAEYEEYPAMITVEQAMSADAPEIQFYPDDDAGDGAEGYPDGGAERNGTRNIYRANPIRVGDYEHCDAPHVTRTKTHIGRMTHLTMETQTARASYDKGRNKLTVWTGCQTVFGVRSTIADFLKLPYSRVRVIKTPMGGSFGCKQETVVEPLAAYAAYDLNADVLLSYTREEQIRNCILKHNVDISVESKADPNGTVRGVSINAVLDAGAYTTVSHWYMGEIGSKSGKVYRIPNLSYDGVCVNTNTPVNGSFRSWGSSEIVTALENHMNQLSGELGIDPVELRLKNVHKVHEEDLVNRMTIGKTHFEECLREGRERFGWEEKKNLCVERNRTGGRYRYGVGMAVGSHTSSCYPYHIDLGAAAARLEEDGSVTVHIAVHDHGCGAPTALRKIAAETLEIDPSEILLEEADTERDRYDYGCFASRTVYVMGQGIKRVCEELIDKTTGIAAAMFGCSADDVDYQEGTFTYGEQSATLCEVACYSLKVLEKDVFVTTEINSRQNPGVSCVHFSEVKVDTFSGETEVLSCLTVHDIGKAINPDMCAGQIGSGIQQGIGVALREEIKIDPKTGKLLTPNLKYYDNANSADVPDYDCMLYEDGDDYGPYGAKSIGEAALVPVPGAIVAAVNDALGTRLYDLPVTPAKVLAAISEGGVR